LKGIADYEFIRSLGSGNHGQFFLARRPPRLPVDTEYVAVKVLVGDSTTETFRRATRELKAFARVSSPYVVATYDAGQQDGVFYYSMEYLDGGSLEAPVRPLDRATTLRAIAHAARAVAALHEVGIVHRDIKPGNVLLSAGGAKLSDLGLAHVFTEGVTVTGVGPVGAIEYVDPAFLLGEPSGPHNDVWSLGAMLHRVLTGTGIYGDLPEQNGLLALRRILSSTPQLSNALPEPLRYLVGDCLAAVADRPAASAVAERIEQFTGSEPVAGRS
jgi:serine/threonine protein kinase